MTTLSTHRDLLLHELRDMYDAEHQIVDALPRMSAMATSPDVKTAFDEHQVQTEEQIRRLEEVFALLDEKLAREPCPGIEGIITEGMKTVRGKDVAGAVRDTALLASARRVEHYEMAAYAGAWLLAQTLKLHDVANALEQTRGEEEETDGRLERLAMKTADLSAGNSAGIVS
ncbi:MAG: DUF892 family protein [Candidatus Peribacteraceae bacterium]|nr:DUF892 family protein [Candidatus Peribacteraceae bacterium]